MAKTLIDIDPELLSQAQQILGTGTKKATVNTALREVVRRWAAAEFGELPRSGVFDGLLPVEPSKAAVPLLTQPVELGERACRFLVDTSAWVRYPVPAVGARLDELSAAGLLATCGVVEL